MKKSLLRIAFYVLTALFLFESCGSNEPKKEKEISTVVSTSSGEVSGYIDDGIFTYKGIPYASAERFMPPKEPNKWDSVLECVDYGPVARQITSWIDDSIMDEKELFSVNVWTQGIKDEKKRPVMLWLHGGGFHFGSGSDPMTDGKALAKKGDIVLVSVNHRLNILGYLDLSACGEKYAQSANAGMLDVVKALEWINKNIKNFGGDPSNVTIFGESGGGGKVGTLMCMPKAKGLFHKAIIQSGTLVNVMTKKKSQALGLKVIEKLGLTPEDVEKLDTISYLTLAKAGEEAILEIDGPRKLGTSAKMFGFSPSVDGVDLIQQPFYPGFADISKDIPLMIGSNLNEFMGNVYAEKDLTKDQAKERLAKTYGNKTDEYITLFAKAYPDYTPQDLLAIDVLFRPYTIMAADARAKNANAPMYAYLLGWKSPVDSATKGSFHGLDIPLAFSNVDIKPEWTSTTDQAYELSDIMSSSWLNFAKTGDPNVEGKLPKWEPYTVENGTTMYFDSICKVVHNHDRELMHLIKPIEGKPW